MGEFGSNFAVLATLSSPPVVGETATLTVAACAKLAARAVVSVTLPDGFEWRTPPTGTAVTTAPGSYGGCEQTAAGEWNLSAMTPVRVSGTVAATRAGLAELAGVVEPAEGQPGPGNAAYVYLTVGADSSHFGYPESSGDAAATTASPRPVPDCG